MHVFPEPQVLQDLREFFLDVTTPGLEPSSYQNRALRPSPKPSTGRGSGASPFSGPCAAFPGGGCGGHASRLRLKLLNFGLEAPEPGRGVLVESRTVLKGYSKTRHLLRMLAHH